MPECNLQMIEQPPTKSKRMQKEPNSDGLHSFEAEDISAKDSYDVQYFRGGGMFRLSTPVMSLGVDFGAHGSPHCQICSP